MEWIARARSGAVIHMQIIDGARIYWMESPDLSIPEKEIEQAFGAGSGVQLVESGDSLFGLPRNSQTFRMREIRK